MQKKKSRILRGISFLILFFVIGLQGCGKEKEIRTYSAFVAVPGREISDDNRMMNRIAEKIGAKANMAFLTGQTPEEKIRAMIAAKEYPDLIDGSDAMGLLLDTDALIPLDDYLDDYPNLKNYLSESQWEQMRQEDGHIYFIPQFDIISGKDMAVQHSGEAFWIQKRVLEWAGYPTVRTLEEYFDLIGRYLEANPVAEDGKKNIGFEILCDDWRYFCLENPPQFLAGYPNDGCAIVDKDTLTASVYDTIPEAKKYYNVLCEQFHQGIIDPETFTQSYSQYQEKLSTGRVIGIIDQYWQFQDAQSFLYGEGKTECTYVALDITLDASVAGAWRSPATNNVNAANGIGITTSCKDVEGVLQFMNDLLEPEIMVMRFWGEEGIDYEVGEDGIYYRTEEQRVYTDDKCSYVYFPHYSGMLADGINAVEPGEQPEEYYSTLNDYDKAFLDAYGYETWTDFLHCEEEAAPWFPLYQTKGDWNADTPYAVAEKKMEEVKREWLPKVIMCQPEEFDQMWQKYMDVYHAEVDVKAYEEKLTEEVRERSGKE